MDRTANRLYDVATIVATAALVVATFILDMIVPIGRSIWLIYFLAMVMSYMSRWVWLPVCVAAAAVVLLAVGIVLGAGDLDVSLFVLNRSIAALVLMILAAVGFFMIRSRAALASVDWENKAQVRLAKTLEGNLSRDAMTARALDVIGGETDARAGILWTLEGEDLVPVGSWGGADPRAAGGHLWRAVHDQRIIHLSAPGPAALGWGSGLLQGRAAHSLIAPLTDGGRVTGLMEFGYDHPPTARETRLLDHAGAKVGLELRAATYRDEVQLLLAETERQAEELRAHGEEMAVTNAELEEQTRALTLSESRLRDQQAELEEQNAVLEQQTAQLEEQRDAIAKSRQLLADQAEELARESRYKSEFVANMSHELRTPLNALLIMARLLSENRQGNLTQEQRQWAETIESAGKDLLSLINDILDIARIEAGRVDIHLGPVAPADILKRLGRVFTPQAQDRGLQFALSASKDLPRIVTDNARVEQILRNFIANAVKFTERGGVTLGVEQGQEEVVFFVRDTGIGIAPEHHKAVFEAFRQADGSISRRFGGTGLGLSISRDLAERLGGHITLESAPGQGSTFRLHLPLTAPEAADPYVAPAPAMAQPVIADSTAPIGSVASLQDDRDNLAPAQRRLLVVEDDAVFAGLLLDLARELGFGAIVVDRADDAIRAAQQYHPDGIVLDVGLPDHSGLTVLDRLKRDAKTRHIPVHVVSAEDHTREALAQGAVSYLIKPVARDALVGALDSITELTTAKMRKLLIVEDDPKQLSGLKALLGADDVAVKGVSTTADALAACRQETFDCIVLDMSLPDGSGFDLLEQLSADENASFPPVIVYTARSLTQAEEQALRRHSRSIIIKGAKSPERLIDEVTLFLHKVVSDLPERQREMLVASLNRDSQLEGRRILVVEDDIRNIYALSGVLEPHGVKIQIARNGREALEHLEKVAEGAEPPVDLVLMDVMMPEMDGMTATREIRRIDRWRNLPVIMLTAKAMADDQAQALAAGANDYLAKPLDVDKLLSLIRVWMPR